MSQHLQPGAEVRSGNNTYIIRSVLGSGGFGITYSATYSASLNGLRVQVVVALKEFFLSADCERDGATGSISVSKPARERAEAAKKDFIGEARRLQQLGQGHHNIISVSEVFEANNTAYYVMEYVEGESLQSYVKSRGSLSESETMAIMRPVIEAAAFLHRNHITHLDIKPANIMMSADEHGLRPVLIDFGLSKHYNEDGSATSTINSMGYSEGYSPIEQYTGIRQFSPQSDVYSLAATIYYCLTGRSPRPAIEVKLSDIDHELQTKGMSDTLRRALTAALSLKPEERPADATALLSLLAGHTPAATPTPIEYADPDATRAIAPTPRKVKEPEKVVAKAAPAFKQPAPPKPAEDETTAISKARPRKRRTWLWITLALLFIIGGATAGYLFWKKKYDASHPAFKSTGIYTFPQYISDPYSEDGAQILTEQAIVPVDSGINFLWCIKSTDGYWLPLTKGDRTYHGDFNAINLRPNQQIYWWHVDYPSGVILYADHIYGDNGIRVSPIDPKSTDILPFVTQQMAFDYSPDFELVDLSNTSWRNLEDERSLEGEYVSESIWNFKSGNKVELLYQDLIDPYTSTTEAYYIAYKKDGRTCVAFVSGDNPDRECAAGYIEGNQLVMHRTGIARTGDEIVVFDRQSNSYTVLTPSAPEAPPVGE